MPPHDAESARHELHQLANGHIAGLSPEHFHQLVKESGIDAEIARERGYRSIANGYELATYGFQALPTPGLLVPIYPPGPCPSTPSTYTYRPDAPADITRKYFNRPKSRNRLDLPPRCHARLHDPRVRRQDVVAVGGIWSFLGTNDLDGKVVLADLRSIALNDGEVDIAYDSDVWLPDAGQKRACVETLTAVLWGRGVRRVRWCRIPHGKDGKKVGPDDFLLDHDIAELESHLADPELADELFYVLNDASNADRLIALFGQDIRHVDELGWFAWGTRRWMSGASKAVREFAKATVATYLVDARFAAELGAKAAQEAARAEAENDSLKALEFAKRRDAAIARSQSLHRHVKAAGNANRTTGLIEQAMSDPRISLKAEHIEPVPWFFNCENGVIDLKSGRLEPHTRDRFMTQLAPVTFDPDASCPTWDAYLAYVQPREDIRRYLQQLVGYGLVGVGTEKVFPILCGTGDTGKSTFVNAIRALFGADYAKAAGEATIAARKGDSIPNDVAMLWNARLVTVSETGRGTRLNAARVKAMTGGSPQVGRFLHQEFFEYVPRYLLLIETNERPILGSEDQASWNRVKLIEFETVIPKEQQVTDFGDQLTAELSGMLNWALAGCRDWQEHGFVEPRDVTLSTQRYRDELDPLAEFFDERCTRESGDTVKQAELFQAYLRWAESANIKQTMKKSDFRKAVLALNGTDTAKGAGNAALYTGIGLTRSGEPKSTWERTLEEDDE